MAVDGFGGVAIGPQLDFGSGVQGHEPHVRGAGGKFHDPEHRRVWALLGWTDSFPPEVLGRVRTRPRRPRSGLVLTRPGFSGGPCGVRSRTGLLVLSKAGRGAGQRPACLDGIRVRRPVTRLGGPGRWLELEGSVVAKQCPQDRLCRSEWTGGPSRPSTSSRLCPIFANATPSPGKISMRRVMPRVAQPPRNIRDDLTLGTGRAFAR